MAELQVIPARHGVATFVPAGQTIKIINTSGTQVIDTWAFALPKPDGKRGGDELEEQQGEQESKKQEPKSEPKPEEKPAQKAAPKKSKKDIDLPSQEDAEKATQEGMKQQADQAGKGAKDATPQKSSWSSYVPSLGLSKGKKGTQTPPQKGETEQQKNSRTWASYFPSGKGFSSYIPKTANDTVSVFAKDVGGSTVRDSDTRKLTTDSTKETRANLTWSSYRTSPKRLSEQQVSKMAARKQVSY